MARTRKAHKRVRITKNDNRRTEYLNNNPSEQGDSAEVVFKRLDERRVKQKRQRTSVNNVIHSAFDRDMGDINDNDTGGELPLSTPSSRRSHAFSSLWEQHKDVIKGWFCEAASFGTPDPTLKQPYDLTEVVCGCKKQSASFMKGRLNTVIADLCSKL
ncbi:hypothetical protein BD770DRAFT_450104 [Pilaira anomala]|nr:hypothetical protein BD770DRAFT_450104 [Pilaira anomala]